MSSQEIKAELILGCIFLSDIADEAGCSVAKVKISVLMATVFLCASAKSSPESSAKKLTKYSSQTTQHKAQTEKKEIATGDGGLA